MKSWLEKNDIAMYSTHNEGKFIVDERFIRASKNEIYKYMTSISKNVFHVISDLKGEEIPFTKKNYKKQIKIKW